MSCYYMNIVDVLNKKLPKQNTDYDVLEKSFCTYLTTDVVAEEE